MPDPLQPARDDVPATATGAAPLELHDTPDRLDTAHLRNVVQARVFGTTIEPLRVGRFPILRRIGSGGMGAVYAAYDNELDRKIALKLLHPHHGRDAEAQRGRLLREAKALARLSHPSVVQVYEAGEHDGRVYLAMEFVRGRTLREWLAAEPRTVASILEVFVQAGAGLAAAHASGLVHRDVKPDNLVVGEDGRVRVVDFGLAIEAGALGPRPVDDDEPTTVPLDRWTQTHGITGTPAYMAPEQMAGEVADARSDQFAFAVTLFEALFGQRPFEGATLPAVHAAIARGEVVHPRRPRVPKPVTVALRRALALVPGERFASIAELVDAVTRTVPVRIRWRFVAFATLALLSAIVAVLMSLSVLRSLEASEDRRHEIVRLREQAEQALHGEIAAKTGVDPIGAVERLAFISTRPEGWVDDVSRLARAIAHGPMAESIVALPEGWSGIGFAADGDVLVRNGQRTGRFALADAVIRSQPHDVPTVGWSITRTATATVLGDPSTGTRVERAIATEVVAVAPAPDGRTLAIGGAAGDVWWIPIDAEDGAPVRAEVGLGGAVQALAWSPDGRDLAVLAAGGSAKVFDVVSRRVRATLPTDDYRAAHWHGDGRLELVSRTAVVRWRLGDAESEVPSDAHGLRAWILAAQPERRAARLE